ncbi:hypothetical protein H6G33_09885 [Calothrix sp. FACHB-1219]|uniref:hypothetical protein n=1 Tax=unclassified Calothrix TaxID=2619626 RepID=UPI0016860F03|nr:MULTISPECIES: hypothetical protein [unclassified Calothrix]MBD2201656.1 hypothetical protein [Calothrix sp. FACHB-168]MBD2217342.1 hypothetical protein [Calothrix sp. FACHB-1219]
MLIRGKVLTNIHCKHEQELNKRDKPRYGSIWFAIDVIKLSGSWYCPNFSIGRDIDKGIDKVRPILEISYRVEKEDYWLVSDMSIGKRYEISLIGGLYTSPKHIRSIDTTRRVLSLYIKVLGHKDNISLVQEIKSTNIPKGVTPNNIGSGSLITLMMDNSLNVKEETISCNSI